MKFKKRGVLTFFLFSYWHEAGWKGFVGATVKIRDMAVNLSDLGHEVVLFVPKCGIDTSRFDFNVVEIPVIDLPGLRMLSFNFFLGFRLLLGGFEARPDVVYLRRTTTLIPMIYAWFCRALFFFEVNDDPYYGSDVGKMPLAARIRYFLSVRIDDWNMKSAARVFVISSEIIAKIRRKNSGLSPARFVLMQSGANTRLFTPGPPEPAREVLGLERKCRYVCFVGSLLSHQGLGTLIEAAPLILEKRPECRFLIVGQGPEKKRWEDMAVFLGISQKFVFTGQVSYEQVPYWIRAADLCVAPYLPDAGFRSPVKIFDYLACGRPVVASDVPGTTGVFKDLEAVVLVPPGNPGRFAEAVISLLDDPDLCIRLGISGRFWVCRNFSRQKAADLVARCARELKSGRGRMRS